MLSYFLRRLILVLPVAFGVSVVCFALVQIAPGDPLTAIMPVDATAEQQAAMRAAYGLDKPVPVQYLIWVGNLLQGEMGRSIASGRPVAAEVFGAVGNSLLLAAAAAVLGKEAINTLIAVAGLPRCGGWARVEAHLMAMNS